MESKKINQLATELAPELSDLTIIGDPTTGISKKITLSQMASLFTGTVEEYANLASFPLVGTADTIYIALDTNIIYRWNTGTSAYVELSPNIVTSLVFSDANGFDGTISLVGSTATLTITTALTQGSVPFIGTSGALSQDNANLFFDDTNNRLGINTNAPTTALDVFGSGIIGRLNGTSTNNAFLGFASAGSNKWSIGNVQSDHRFRIYSEATTSELVSVLQTGEFGIGIANPTTKLHIDGGASALIANLDADVSIAKSISFRSDNSARINLEVSGTESGSNAGANFFIRRYSDAGALIDTPLTITRSTGAITLTGALSGTSATFNTNSTSNAGFFQINDSTTTLGNSFATVQRNANDGNGRFSLSRWQVQNTSGLEQSAFIGAQAVTGASNYSPNLILGVSNGASSYTTYLTIASTGAATFSGALIGTTADFQTTIGSRYLQIRDAGTSTPSLRSVNDTIAQLRAFAIEANTISLRTGASSGLTTTEALAISATGAATFSGGLLTVNVPTDNTTVGIFHAGGGTANRGLKISTFAATNDNAGVTLDAQTSTGVLAFATATTERMRITSGGAVKIGTGGTEDANGLHIRKTGNHLLLQNTNNSNYWNFDINSNNLLYIINNNNIGLLIDNSGVVMIGTSNTNPAENNVKGVSWFQDGRQFISSDNNEVMRINRKTSDGALVYFHQDGVAEGNISVSGTTVSYNGGHLSRYSQTETYQRIEGLLKGTVMSNLDKMAQWINPETSKPYENEQLNCMKISDVEGDVNVAGVFVNWDDDDKFFTNDFNIAMTGDMIIRISKDVIVEKGQLLMSAGDGTAKPQGDDIIRAKTIAKVISNHISCTYEDGSYCVPCVLMAC